MQKTAGLRPTVHILRAPETIRTSDRWYRKPVLYPLSYGGNDDDYSTA